VFSSVFVYFYVFSCVLLIFLAFLVFVYVYHRSRIEMMVKIAFFYVEIDKAAKCLKFGSPFPIQGKCPSPSDEESLIFASKLLK